MTLACVACLCLLFVCLVFFFNRYILHSISSFLLIDFNFNDSRNKCSFSFQSDVSINVYSTASSLYFCLLQIYYALFWLLSVWLYVCILHKVRSLLWLNFALESSTILLLFNFNFQVNIYFAVFFQFVFVSYVRIYPWTFFSELWLIVTLIFYQVFALSCLTIALVSYAIFQANFTLTIWISFLFSSLFDAEIK